MNHFRIIVSLFALTPVLAAHAQAAPAPSLTGTWQLTAANKLLPDGSEVADYGTAPHGMVVFTADGNYMVEIYRADRIRFAANDKQRGTADEYKDASLSTSCHFGQYVVDTAKAKIIFNVDRSSFPNWDNTSRAADFNLAGDTLSWRTPARPDGSVPVTYLKRIAR